jgi:phosphoglycolate phosphatase-like HAD superfamily hydrolase
MARYTDELADAFAARRDLLTSRGRLLPGALEAVRATAALPGVVQSVLTGSIRPNAAQKLRAFGLDGYFDLEIGGYGNDAYPRGSQLMDLRRQAEQKYRAQIPLSATVYVADAVRDAEAARTAGVRCVAVASGRSTVADLQAAAADAVLTDLTDTALVVAAVDRLTRAAAS